MFQRSAGRSLRPTLARTSRPSVPTGLYAQAARALRNSELQEARQHLDAVAESNPKEADRVQILQGLYAAEAGDSGLAQELLAEASGSDRSLEDWRLFLLAESALENDRPEDAAVALERLLAGSPGSPLRAQAYLQAARLAREEGDERRTLSLIEGARREGVTGKAAVEMENLAWDIGREIDDDQVSREAGRRLLTRAPLTAGALGVADTFRAMDGDLDWTRILSTGEVKQRARSFLSVERLSAALDTLDNVPQAERDVEWHLLQARVLTESGDAREALDVLASVSGETQEDRAGLEWERTLATARLSRLEEAHRHLSNAVRFGAKAELSEDALSDLYDDFLDAGLIAAAVDTLKLLRHLDPGDTTGARDLWERGWTLYGRGDLAGAVTFWGDLAEIYPEHGDAQRGRYWQARALEQIGRPGEARVIYTEMLASSDTSDFYNRRAMARLGVPPGLLGDPARQGPGHPVADRSPPGARQAAHRPRTGRARRSARWSWSRTRRTTATSSPCRRHRHGPPGQAPRQHRPAARGLPGARRPAAVLGAGGDPARLLPARLRGHHPRQPRQRRPARLAGRRHHPPGERLRPARHEPGGRARPDAAHAGHGPRDGRQGSASATRRRASTTPSSASALGTAYFRAGAQHVRRQRRAGPRRLQRRPEPHPPDVERGRPQRPSSTTSSRTWTSTSPGDYVKRILVLSDSYRQLYPAAG